jgi:hypothetical protein
LNSRTSKMDSALTQLFLSLADSTLPARHAREVGA